MTVNTSSTTSGPYAGNDVTVDFSYTFRIEDKSQLTVYLTDALGAVSILTVDVDYTVAGIGVDGGGTITMTVAPATGETLFIRSSYSPTQLTDFDSQGGFYPTVHEAAFDKLTFLIQQILDVQDRRTLLFNDNLNRASTLNLIPDPVEGQVLAWQSDGSLGNTPLVVSTTSASYIGVATYTLLKAISIGGLAEATPVIVKHRSTEGDRGGGIFHWYGADLSAQVTADTSEGIYVPPTSDTSGASGCWVRQRPNLAVSPRWYGAKGDGVTNDKTACLAAIASGFPVYWEEGTYLTDGSLIHNSAAWFGDGWHKSIIKCSGDNGGVEFLKPPVDWSGMAVEGDVYQGTAVAMGQEYSFTGGQYWRNLRVYYFDLGVRAYNFYNVHWDHFNIVYNNNGLRITPLNGVGDDGYFTTFQMDSCLLGYGTGYGIRCSVPLGNRNWMMNNCVVEGFCSGSSTATFQGTWDVATAYALNDAVIYNYVRYVANQATLAGDTPGVSGKWDAQSALAQIQLSNAKINANGLYMEACSGAPAISVEDSNGMTLFIQDPYFNGTGGVWAGTGSFIGAFKEGSHVSANDKMIWWAGSIIQKLMKYNSSVTPSVESPTHITDIAQETLKTPKLYLGNAALAAVNQGIYFNMAWRKSLNGVSVTSGSIVTVVTNQYYSGIATNGSIGKGFIYGGYYPGAIVNITPATTGSTEYWCAHIYNASGSTINFGAADYLNVMFFKTEYLGI